MQILSQRQPEKLLMLGVDDLDHDLSEAWRCWFDQGSGREKNTDVPNRGRVFLLAAVHEG